MTVLANDAELIESLDLIAVRQMRCVQTNEFSQLLSPQYPHIDPRICSHETKTCAKRLGGWRLKIQAGKVIPVPLILDSSCVSHRRH